MAKSPNLPPALFNPTLRHRRVLILPKFLYGTDPQQNAAETQFRHDDGPPFRRAHEILKKWAGMETRGLLKKKETAIDANFLADVFGLALGYLSVQHAAADGTFTLDRQFAVPGVGPADGALGFFPLKDPANPAAVAVIELKGSDTDLDTDKSNGRSAVQQLFDYLNGLPETKWGIASNFSTIRLYHKSRGSQTYEEFSLQKLAHDLDHFKAFWCLLEKNGMFPSLLSKIPRAEKLLAQTGERQKEVGNRLYSYFDDWRSRLRITLRKEYAKPLDEATRIAQKIVDRIIFVAFCEASGLFPPNCRHRCLHQIGMRDDSPNPRWRNIQNLFYAVFHGHEDLGYDEGLPFQLFADDASIEECQLGDDWAQILATDPPSPLNETAPDHLAVGFPAAVHALDTFCFTNTSLTDSIGL